MSVILVYLSLRGVDMETVVSGLREVEVGYVIGAVLIMIIMQVVRALRWGALLRPLAVVGFPALFSVTSVGFLAIVALPARLGELARPYLITKKSPVPMSAALGTIVMERLLDSLTVFSIFLCVFALTPLPPWLVRASVFFILLTAGVLAVVLFALRRRGAGPGSLSRLTDLLPRPFYERFRGIIGGFLDGFRVMRNRRPLVEAGLLSVVFWLIDALAIYLMLRAFGLALPPVAPFVILIILIIGIAIPAGPGFVGNWHFFCILALSLYDVPKAQALSFAVLYHFLSIATVVVLGLIYLPFNPFSWGDLKRAADPGAGENRP